MLLFSIRDSQIENTDMALKPQDVLVLLKLIAIQKKEWSYNGLAVELGMSPSEVHGAGQRALAAQLAVKRAGSMVPNVRNLEEFLVHGIRYAFFPEWGGLARGMPTLFGASPLAERIVPSAEPVPVWPDPEGEAYGSSFMPLYKSAPKAARADAALYELLVLVDAIRGGKARERNMGVKEIQGRLARYEKGE
ncbi:MAG: MarR family transcriptional regulator [Xanthomonadaceae bacterium]|nr:MarR family transcriptional regulator [Xanthomonadaceae bacterium]